MISLIIFPLLWILTGFISQEIAKVLIILSFLFLLFKNEFILIFLLFYIVLFFSDSRLINLIFFSELKPIIAILFFLISILFIYKNDLLKEIALTYSTLPFIFFILISTLINSESFQIYQKSFSYVLMHIIPFPILFYITRDNKKIFLKLLILSFILISTIGLIFTIIFPEIVYLNNRYCGLFGNPNGLGIASMLFLFIFHIINTKKLLMVSKNEFLFISLLFIINIIFSQSRSCIISVLVFYLFNFLFNYSVFYSVIFTLFAFVLMGLASFNLKEIIYTLNLESYIRIDTINNASGRYIAWDFLLKKLDKNFFFFGNGIGSTEFLFKKNYSLLSRLGHEGNAHNSFLTFWYDIGFLGLISYTSFLLYSFLNSKSLIIYFPVMLGIFVSSFFESWLSASLNPFTILLIIIIVIINLPESVEKIN